jgi:hypothetical protein
VRTHTANCVGKMSLKNCQILENVLEILRFPSPILRFPSPKIQFSSPKIQFSSHNIRFSRIGFLLSSTAFRFLQLLSDFLQQLSAFSNSFPIFSNGFPIFLNGFPLSEKSEKIYLWQDVYERSLFELCIFCHLLPKLRNSRYNTQHFLLSNFFQPHVVLTYSGTMLNGPFSKWIFPRTGPLWPRCTGF